MSSSTLPRQRNLSKVVRLLAIATGILLSSAFSTLYAAPAMVWSQYDQPNVNVYYSQDGTRTQGLTAIGTHVLPNLFQAAGLTWICWVDKSNAVQNRLMFAQLDADSSVLEIGSLATEHGRIYAPAIAMDSNAQRAWLVWAENNGRREILYASYRDIGKHHSDSWQPALQITADDQYSSNLPVIEEVLDDGIRISWMRSDPESAQTAEAKVSIAAWAAESPASADRQTQRTSRKNSKARYHSFKTKKLNNYDHLIKRLDKANSLSEEERAWLTRVQGRKVLTGAIHSGRGPSERLALGAKK